MLVTLIGNDSIYKITLPQNVVGNYWISDKSGLTEKKLVNIEAINGKWQITSNKMTKVINSKCINVYKDRIGITQTSETVVNRIILRENNMYGISIGNTNNLYILYCSPVYENNFSHFDIKNTSEILIGNNGYSHIAYTNALIDKVHARIFYNNGRWMLENYDTKFGTFLNNNQVGRDMKALLNGDVIFIMGLKIIIMGSSLFVNNPGNAVKINQNNLILEKGKEDIGKYKFEDDEEAEIYAEEDYFSRAPRISDMMEKEKVKIDAPPQRQNQEEMPLALTLGSMLSMGAVMMISMVSSLDNLFSGKSGMKETILTVLVSATMLVGMLVFPILTNKWQRKQKVKYEEKRQKRYKDYINSKIQIVERIKEKHRKILFENYVATDQCTQIVLEKSPRLWERKIEDEDFLSVRLGIGDAPLKIDINYPEDKFTMEDDNLLEYLSKTAEEAKILKDAPIVVSLAEKNISSLIVNDDVKLEKFMQGLIMQLITFHSYEDLKLVFLLKDDKQNKWDYIKMLPHIWNNSKQVRFFAENQSDIREISRFLEDELERRKYTNERDADYKSFSPYYLIITDDYKRIEDLKIIRDVLGMKTNLGFSLLCVTNNINQLPNECKTFIQIDDNKVGTVFENEISSSNRKEFMFDASQTIFFGKISQTLANIPIKYNLASAGAMPNSYTFLDMYDAGRIEQLNAMERWTTNDATLSLKAPIGVDSTGTPIVLDIHEKFHGPHGLIAGSTGSGKSEFIITYILSLAINYHPDDVTFMLIDYKGGGLAGAFQKRKIKLPHLVGTITNIDTVGLQRSLDSIQSELRRRQVMFNEARNMTDESTIDIYKYQKLYHQGVVKKPIPHLLIICDEFAELKQQQEEFMDELISVARIGRSLGIHLILATQKPAGIVNDQIRSNSKFAVCLKVQDKMDSNDVIKKPLAADLKNAGQFYLQVGNDEYFVLGQSAWAGAPYFPKEMTKKKLDTSIEFISDIGTVIKKVNDTVIKIEDSEGDQLTGIVRYMYELAEQNNIRTNQLWLDTIPENIYVKNLRKKYHVETKKNLIEPIIGEYDDPYNQRQGVVTLPITKEGNAIIFGNADSGKETLLSTIIYDVTTTHTNEEAQFYILDFGSEALKIFSDNPSVGDVIFATDVEKINRFFDIIQNEIRNRKSILSEYNGDYNLYIATSGQSMPEITVIINNYEAFYESYGDKYEDIFQTITRECVKCGISFIITASAYHNIRYRLAQNFKQKIALQLNNEDDYLNIFEKAKKKRPSRIFGRGLVALEEGKVYEFQTAKITEPEKWNEHVKAVSEQLKEINKEKAKGIPTTPDIVTIEDVKESLTKLSKVPIGLVQKNLKVCTYNFENNFMSIVTSKNIEGTVQFTSSLIELVKKLKNLEILVFDAEQMLQNSRTNIKEEYQKFISKMEKDAKAQNRSQTLCLIFGLNKFLNDLEDNFEEIIGKAKKLGNYNFIIIENANKLKNHEYESWYKEYINSDNGIWIGNGIDNQYLININSDRREIINNCGVSYGYQIKDGNLTLIKLLGVKEKGDDDE